MGRDCRLSFTVSSFQIFNVKVQRDGNISVYHVDFFGRGLLDKILDVAFVD